MGKQKTSEIGEIVGDEAGAESFRSALVEWFRSEGRDYPWRRTRDPYAILVSEAMLQQTQIATVLGRGYYVRWMDAFPTWEALAGASEDEILKLWEGLGYYNRARNLRRAAEIVVNEHGGRLPEDLEAIGALPGVGRYTAGAVFSFAFDRPAPIVDGNISRVFSRLFAFGEPVNVPAGAARIWAWAEALVSPTLPRLYNSALMELGQRICRPAAPTCGECPVAVWCLANRRGETANYPVKKKPVPVTLREEHVVIALRNGRVYLRPETGGRRRGLWRLPELSSEVAADLDELFCFSYPITRYRVTLRVHESAAGAVPDECGSDGDWFPRARADDLPPLGSPYRKALARYAELIAARERS